MHACMYDECMTVKSNESEALVLSASQDIHQGKWACTEGNRLVLFMEEALPMRGFPAGLASWNVGVLLTGTELEFRFQPVQGHMGK